MIQLGLKPGDDKTYKLDEAARILNLGFGRNTLYAILKELKIVNNLNVPARDYIEKGYLILEVPELRPNPTWVNHPVTIVNGKKGLDFIKETVKSYLKNNPKPKIKRKKQTDSYKADNNKNYQHPFLNDTVDGWI